MKKLIISSVVAMGILGMAVSASAAVHITPKVSKETGKVQEVNSSWTSTSPSDVVSVTNVSGGNTAYITVTITTLAKDPYNGKTLDGVTITCNGSKSTINPGSAAVCTTNQTSVTWSSSGNNGAEGSANIK